MATGAPRATARHPQHYVRFPPRWRNVLVPVGRSSATALGMTLYTASKPVPLAAQRALWLLAELTRGRAVLGPRETWAPPMGADTFDRLWSQWCAVLADPIEGIAIYERTQSARATLTLMLCAGRSSALVRVRQDAASLTLERRVSEAAAADPARTFAVPRLRGSGQADAWTWVAYEAMSQRPHGPKNVLGAGVPEDISRLVEAVLERPAGIPAHWRGAHGDLTPWNLRRSHTGTWLIDWEDARWLPPNADRVYFEAAVTAVRPGRVEPLAVTAGNDEAIRFWAKVISLRVAEPGERQFQSRLETMFGVTG